MGANFSPEYANYIDMKPFRFWCQKVLPAIYDDSLSYYELLTKVVAHLNTVIDNMEAVEQNTNAVLLAFNQLQDYVNNYFSSLDVQTEINNALNEMAQSGTLDEILAPIVEEQLGGVVSEQIDGAVAEQIDESVLNQLPNAISDMSPTAISDAVDSWLDTHLDPQTATVIDDSLTISGAAADAKVTGEKIQEAQAAVPIPVLSWTKGYLESNGSVSASNYSVVSNLIPINGGGMIVNKTPSKDSSNVSFTMYLGTYGENGFIQKIGIGGSATRRQVIGENVTHIRFLFGRLTSSGVTWQDSDIDYWNCGYYLKTNNYQQYLTVKTMVDSLDESVNEKNYALFAYTDYDEEVGYWYADGSLGNSLSHSQLLKIIPNQKFYMGTIANQEIIGGFFDANKQWIAPMRTSEAVEVNYPVPSKGSGSFTYRDIYEITPPDGACYVSINIRTGHARAGQCVCSKPMFLKLGTGNIAVGHNEILANTGKKKLCVIGASTAMIDRFYSSALSEFVCGWEEYTALWYKDFEIFGYSGGSMGAGYTEYTSIYAGIIGEQVDLSGFDDFIILSTKNGLSVTGVGTWGTLTDPPASPNTYMGGLRYLVDYIYSQNRKANIWVTTMQYDQRYFSTDTWKGLVNTANYETLDMGKGLGIPVIDLAAESGFNAYTYYDSNDPTAGYTYDGTHFNQDGNYQIGKVVRKAVLGF